MITVEVRDSSQVAEARRSATRVATTCGASDTEAGRTALIATELATNLLKHGGGGELIISSYENPSGDSGIQLIALDKGRGMADVQACLRDGYSSAGSAGNGLGAIQRQSHLMEIASWPELGTVILVQVRLAGAAQAAPPFWGALCIPKPGEEVCGDAVSVVQTATARTSLVVDGLGHGPEAASAAHAAVRIFQREAHRPLTELLEFIHTGLRPTRGAAAAIARWSPATGIIEYGGIGNIAGVVIFPGNSRHMVSINGTLGLNARKMQAFEYPCPRGGLMVMHSDGVSSSWSLDKYAGLLGRHPLLIAAVIYRDYARRRDDVSVLVSRSLT